ncbi:MAG: ABC transporter ATP-binding protein [Oscillospiraceae bacterium]|nr:ABC transporter ATP-binding protein [Oscillospiraceae bacterium]
MVEIQNLSCGYSGKNVLSQLSLTAPEGCLTAIIGPNGCGKSTLLKAMTGILPYEGSIQIRGQELRQLSPKDRARMLALVPQNRSVPEITVEKLVLHGRFPYLSYPRSYRQQDKAIAKAAMEQIGILDLKDRQLSSLSGGERQKAYIAMMLAQETPVVVMDEPTSFLDISCRFELMALAKELSRKGKNVIMVIHDLQLALTYADRIALMEQGCIRSFGTPGDVLESGWMERVFSIRIGQTKTPAGTQFYFSPL